VSPRAKIEEEFKIPFTHKTQSYQGESVLQQTLSRGNDFGSLSGKENEINEEGFFIKQSP